MADVFLYIIDVAQGDDIPRKGGPGITQSDLLIVNKINLAPYVGVNLQMMEMDCKKQRNEKQTIFTNVKKSVGVSEVAGWLEKEYRGRRGISSMGVKGEWRGIVSLIGERNYLTDSIRQFPLKAVNFQGEDGEMIIYLISSSPGLFNGDRQDISCRLTDGAHLFLTDASATELHPSLMEEASRMVQTFQLEKTAN